MVFVYHEVHEEDEEFYIQFHSVFFVPFVVIFSLALTYFLSVRTLISPDPKKTTQASALNNVSLSRSLNIVRVAWRQLRLNTPHNR